MVCVSVPRAVPARFPPPLPFDTFLFSLSLAFACFLAPPSGVAAGALPSTYSERDIVHKARFTAAKRVQLM